MSDKRRARQGSVGGNLTPKQAKTVLAAPVYAILSGQATPVFPGTNLASSSGLVGIFRKPGLHWRTTSGRRAVGYPVWVNGRQWDRAVVPVLTDPRWSTANPVFAPTTGSGVDYVIDLIGEALAQSFHEAGYGPLP
jgi:hypothetical protein